MRYYIGFQPKTYYARTDINENDGFIKFLQIMDPTMKVIDQSEVEPGSTINVVTKDENDKIVVSHEIYKREE